MGANFSSVESIDDSLRPRLEDIPESCIALVLTYLDPTEICNLARLNRSFRCASTADFIWESKLPSNYRFIASQLKLFDDDDDCCGDAKKFRDLKGFCLCKKDIFARLSRFNSFDGGNKEIWLHKKTGGMCISISSKSLSITGIHDRRYWNHIPSEESRVKDCYWCIFGPIPMELQRDILDSLDRDTAIKIFLYLDPADVIRVSSVSHGWRDFIISNGICKQLCLRLFPQLFNVFHGIDTTHIFVKPVNDGCSSYIELEQVKEHKMFARLLCGATAIKPVDCISGAISASSTDNYPEEGIHNTLEPRDKIGRRASYWSSSGQSDPTVPEKLLYNLSELCFITEIKIKPFKAFFQPSDPIYSANAVRFRMGHKRVCDDIIEDQKGNNDQLCGDDKFVWTYTSQEFPMAQNNSLQRFLLPEPVLCIDGILQIELLGRVQRQEMDNLFYICVAHVQALGRSLSPVFGKVDLVEPPRRFLLKYNPEAQFARPHMFAESDGIDFYVMTSEEAPRRLAHFLNIFHGNLGVEVYDSDEEHPDSDDEFAGEFVA